jgi:hypothetical protein
MTLKRILSVLTFVILFTSLNAKSADISSDKMLDEACTIHYKNIDDFLQYLYRVDGNLTEINPSKIKRIQHLEKVFGDYRSPNTQRSAAFDELFSDPDWWVYKLQRNSRKLIAQLEAIKKDSSWVAFKKLATQQALRQITENYFTPSATRSMESMVQLIYSTADFFQERIEIKDRLEALGASSRLSRAFATDIKRDALESGMHFYLPKHLMTCQIDFLASRLNRKQ